MVSVTVTVCVAVDMRTKAMIRLPNELLPGNVCDKDVTAFPCIAACWNRATPLDAATIVTDMVCECDRELLVPVTVKLYLPGVALPAADKTICVHVVG